MWRDLTELIKLMRKEPWTKGLSLSEDFWFGLMGWIEDRVLSDFLGQVTQKVDEIVEIDPEFTHPQILERATRHMVDFLGARSASVRIYDPQTEQMLSFGSYPFQEHRRQTYIPFEGGIAGEVVKTRNTFLVPNILDEPLYHNKEIIQEKGVHSLMAIPLEIARFFPHERDTVGVIQIYYPEKDRTFTALEIKVANLMAKRLSFVIARKKILSMHRLAEKKEALVRQIFRTLGSRAGIKMKDVFNRVMPELADMVNLESCALFSITNDLNTVILEAGYPESESYHSIGKRFSIKSEPAYERLLNLTGQEEESPYDVVTSEYILVVDPLKSPLTSEGLKRLCTIYNINSILYIPLFVNGEITHFLTFDALEQRQRYQEDEIELFLFLGRELMKAQRMERLDDILHDFKNPAIATAGFARRLKKLIEDEDAAKFKDQIRKYADILLEETSRLQELALSIYQVGEEHVVNLTEVLERRFEINQEAIKEQLKQNVTLKAGPFDRKLTIRCYPLHLERVFDNLLNNATKAIPLRGGTLKIKTYSDGEWACAEIMNSGLIPKQDRYRLLEGEGEGRGLYITNRIIKLLQGRIEVRSGKSTTTFVVRLPFYREGSGD
jgi:signal transduction histidine kinase